MSKERSLTQKKIIALLGTVDEDDKLNAALHFAVSYDTIKRYLAGTSFKERFGKKLLEYFENRLANRELEKSSQPTAA